MNWRREWKPLVAILAGFLILYLLPVDAPRFRGAVDEALALAQWYAREHVVLCLVPAFFIAGAISVFVSQASVLRYLGGQANRVLAYGVASISGTILAVCSCTVLPLFAGIYRMGAGLGPATTFLYSGPAINVLAIVLTARVLGPGLGLARAVGAIGFSVVIGVAMHVLFRKEEAERAAAHAIAPGADGGRPLWQNAAYFGALVAILVFANWGAPAGTSAVWSAIHAAKWYLTALAGIALAVIGVAWLHMRAWQVALAALPVLVLAVTFSGSPVFAFAAGAVGLSVITSTDRGEAGEWFAATWGFARQILPLLLGGVLVAGLLLGRPGHESLIPSARVAGAVGGNSLGANLIASVLGAFMYFATLTEVPIVQGLIGAGMGSGPALALLLAGPALSLPSMLVIRSILGTKKTVVFVGLVVVMATVAGMAYGAFAN